MRPFVPFLLLVVGSCASTETVSIPPLPVGDQPILFADALKRIRSHADTATEAFYRDEWENVAASARRIEETAAFLRTSVQVPPSVAGKLNDSTKQLLTEAKSLSNAAGMRDATKVGESLSRIRFEIRTLQMGR